MFLRVFGNVGRKGVQGRGVGERVNPLPKMGLDTSDQGSTDLGCILGALGPPLGHLLGPFSALGRSPGDPKGRKSFPKRAPGAGRVQSTVLSA